MKTVFPVAMAIVAILTSCSGSSTGKSPSTDNSLSAPTIQLPTVPSTLTNPVDRANYVITHYWDALDFADTTITRNAQLMEQKFADYVDLFPHANADTVSAAITNLMNKAATNETNFRTFAEMAEKYLYNVDSPMYDESLYLSFVNAMLAGNGLNDLTKLRYEHQLAAMSKNKPRDKAGNFKFIDRAGTHGSLSKLAQMQPLLLLMFYDPTCDLCSTAIDYIEASQSISDALNKKRLKILAVCAECNSETFTSTKHMIPDGWIDAYCPDETLLDDEVYSLRSLPAIYLIDANGKVVLKNADPLDISDYLNNN